MSIAQAESTPTVTRGGTEAVDAALPDTVHDMAHFMVNSTPDNYLANRIAREREVTQQLPDIYGPEATALQRAVRLSRARQRGQMGRSLNL